LSQEKGSSNGTHRNHTLYLCICIYIFVLPEFFTFLSHFHNADSTLFLNQNIESSQISTPDLIPIQHQDSVVLDFSKTHPFKPQNEEKTRITCIDLFKSPPSMVHTQVSTTSPHVMASRPKSSNINIKRSRNEDDSVSDYSTERMYDWATWRMYHRITSARRSRTTVVPMAPSYQYSTQSENRYDIYDDSLYPNTGLDDSRRTKSLNDLNLEGEVFVLDI
jgi:hypothetical protein